MALGPRRLVYGEVDLFRYSAVTGNAHRIHYDAPYAKREGFAGPLVHSTLHATMLLMTLRDALTGDARILTFRWRNHRPLTAATPVTITGTVTPTGDGHLAAELASYRDDGELVASAQATVRKRHPGRPAT